MELNSVFIKETESFYGFLKDLNEECAAFDRDNPSMQARQSYVASVFEQLAVLFDRHFEKIWDFILSNKLAENASLYSAYKSYYYEKLSQFLLSPAVNYQINKKPLGYPGDFVVMNYIYNNHSSTGNFLGDTTFEMLVNRYTCSIPIAYSNIKRKEYFEQRITELMVPGNKKIASIACGPMREVFDIVAKKDAKGSVVFTCFDFEQKVFDYINSQFAKYGSSGIEYVPIKADILDLIKDKKMQAKLQGQDFIYCSGLFDYLSDRISEKLVKTLFGFLNTGGELVVCNASNEFSAHRAYYEFLGDWTLIYRNKGEVLAWTKNLPEAKDVKIFQTHDKANYWFLSLKK